MTRKLFQDGKARQRMVAVIEHEPGTRNKRYRVATDKDLEVFHEAEEYLTEKQARLLVAWGMNPVPDEELPLMSGVFNVAIYGINQWGSFSIRGRN